MTVAGIDALSEKEKQTLRLLLVGHDAKSIARHFDLSVHTINERLRDARRKLSVSSSKEAARLLREAEGSPPEIVGDTQLRDASGPADASDAPRAPSTPRTLRAVGWAIGGTAMLSIIAALLALSAPNQLPAEPSTANAPSTTVETEASKAARDWLALVDAANWQRSWEGTGASFRSVNTVANWQAASQKARVPLGPVVSRTLISDVDTPAPPNGYRTVQFRTDFANRRGATETIALNRERGVWKVVGIYID